MHNDTSFQGFEPDVATVEAANAAGLSTVEVTNDPIEGVRDADVIYTDVWASMQEKDQAAKREAIFRPYQVCGCGWYVLYFCTRVCVQVNAEMMGRAGKDCLFMHCLPAERGRECTDEVIEGAQSVVWDQVWGSY